MLMSKNFTGDLTPTVLKQFNKIKREVFPIPFLKATLLWFLNQKMIQKILFNVNIHKNPQEDIGKAECNKSYLTRYLTRN